MRKLALRFAVPPGARALAWLFAFALAWRPGPAAAAPPGAPPARIIELWANSATGLENNHKAKVLSSALRDHVTNADEFFLVTEDPQLLRVAGAAKCDTRPFTEPKLTEASDRGMNRACLERVAKRLGAPTFFWGYLFEGEAGRLWVKLHLWRQGDDLSFALPYDEKSPRRLAERLYQHVVSPGKVGDVRFVAPGDGAAARGELYVNGRSFGPWEAQGAELTLPTGEVTAEVRWGDKVLARGRGAVAASGTTAVTLETAAEPPATATEPLRRYPPVEMGAAARPDAAPSGAWMKPIGWVALGTGAAALGVGVLSNARVANLGDDFQGGGALAAYREDVGSDACEAAERGGVSSRPGAATPGDVRDHCSSIDTWKSVRAASYVGGGLLVAGGAALLLLAPSSPSSSSGAKPGAGRWAAAPLLGPSLAGASMRVTW